MGNVVIRVENLTKEYRLGTISHGTLKEDLQSWWARLRGKEDPNSIVTHPASLHSHQNPNPRFLALDDVSFDVKQGEAVGIIGRNGAGKSTLLKILSRVTAPTRGEVRIRGRVASLLEVGTGFHPELTGRENIFLNGTILGMKRGEVQRKFDEIVAFAEIEQFIDTPVKRYSSGMYVRLAFAVAAHLEPEILIIDEVLAVGDLQFQKKCLGKMGEVGREGRTVLFVSHNMHMIESLCSASIFLRDGRAHGPAGISDGIALYLGQASRNRRVFENKPLKHASVEQKGDTIEIIAAYAVDRELAVPCLGFVISDCFGNPVCGSNPVISPQEETAGPGRSGVVRVTVEYPKLLNGTYRLSLWFGDGREDFFHERDCLVFDVVNMVATRQLPVKAVGAVSPVCHWEFTHS